MFYSQVIVVPRLEGLELFDRLIRLVVEEGRVILVKDPALQDLLAQGERELLEDLDIKDVIKEIGKEIKAELRGIGTVVVDADIDIRILFHAALTS